MKNFFKLLNFELNRFMKLFIILLVTIAVIQIIGTIILARSYMMQANQAVLQGGMSQQEFIDMYSPFSMIHVIYSLWFMGPIAIGVAALMFYVFFIWYRDWFARNTFIYRLLMLPTSRMNIFFSKATTIMLTVLAMVAYQVILLNIEKTIVKWLVPKVYRQDLRVVDLTVGSEYLSKVLPQGIVEFLIAYGLGLGFIVVIFTVILFERSYRIKGIIFGLLYAFIAFVLFVLPLSLQLFGCIYLYPMETLIVQIVMWIIIVGASLILSRYLLKNKVTV
ncbi:hypothetical protein [Pseudogracilibacillus sp. SO30301A]|uniref:hypothetical protein n=1 Tax=Pseudogracilibacillus sp. SO30301A TaxID=3098291 RepID=UPI00300E294E